MWNISYEKPKDPRWIDRTGQVFGRLRVVSFDYVKRNDRQSRSFWKCICECGIEVSVASHHLANGATVSCGCYNIERTRKQFTTHGLSEHPVYYRANEEVRRCHDPNHEQYHNYGGRGITVYKPWRDDIGLMTRDILRLIGEFPTPKHQLDRLDNDKGYYPDNICWKTPEENNRNKRSTHNQAVDPITRKSTPTYMAWTRLLYNYGNEVCEEWRSDGNPDTDSGFKNFYKDMGERPKDRHYAPLVRIDETKPFQKGNVVWGYGQGKRKKIKP